MREIAREPWSYTFTEQGPGDYILTVVCGGAGLYDYSIRLDQQQVAGYQKEGMPFILRLIEQVRFNQSPFEKQKV
ncbi:hypothetical protein [Dyadobacter pollutisoli]|uniref:Uncharacterized protein n=1 Tax=Dyadobacter pollutisoli TaxID=2910158 RepID=A0A9E8NC63_9BACT|nr:hypothetical protein [Dyadobacter pollutisoli]WAC13298.1 hypothetical protein ON006_04895 [Dyadobacter pollutisoli]